VQWGAWIRCERRALGAVGGRTKRAHGVGIGSSGGPDPNRTDEDGIEMEGPGEENMDVDALAAHVTIVFEDGRGSAPPRYVLVAIPPRPYSVICIV
jgi:hypothetical protein